MRMRESRLPNVILIVMDTTRAKNLSCYGHFRQTTPFLDQLASDSTLYMNATSTSSWTLPGHASLFTGTFPSRNRTYLWQSKLPSSLKTMAEFFTDVGYDTVAFTSNAWVSEVYGLRRGFETFFKNWQFFHVDTDLLETYRGLGRRAGLEEQIKALIQGPLGRGNPIKNLTNVVYGKFLKRTFDYGARKANRTIQRWYTSMREGDKPFFLFINYMEPHLRYEAPGHYRFLHVPDGIPRERVKSVNQNAAKYVCGTVEMGPEDFEILEALYDGELSYLDMKLKELLHFFDAQGELDNSMVIITSDHGENIGDHGLMSHKYSLHETLIHIPLIMRWPGNSAGGNTVSAPVQLVDLFPTLVEWLEADNLKWTTQFQGTSLLSSCARPSYAVAELPEPNPPIAALKRMGGEPRKPVSQYDRKLLAFKDERYKYIWASDGQEELYDLIIDPGESRNLVKEMESKLAEFRKYREAWELQQETEDQEVELTEPDAIVLRRLQDLGYL